MAADGLAGRVQTVLGTIDPDEMGMIVYRERSDPGAMILWLTARPAVPDQIRFAK